MRMLALLVLVGLWPASAAALDEREVSLAGGVGPTWETTDGRLGGKVELRLRRGLTDAWSGRLGLQGRFFPGQDGVGPTYVTTQGVGLTFSIDALKVIPFADLGVVIADVRGGGRKGSQRLGAEAGLGLDYLLSRHMAIVLLGQVEYLALRLAGGEGARPFMLDVTLGFEYLF